MNAPTVSPIYVGFYMSWLMVLSSRSFFDLFLFLCASATFSCKEEYSAKQKAEGTLFFISCMLFMFSMSTIKHGFNDNIPLANFCVQHIMVIIWQKVLNTYFRLPAILWQMKNRGFLSTAEWRIPGCKKSRYVWSVEDLNIHLVKVRG